jgi:hypothetical protein
MTAASADRAAAAAAYARQGLAVVPCWGVTTDGRCGCSQPACDSIAKHPYAPLAPRGCYSASRDPDVVAGWWAAEPSANVALATGRAHGLLVLDIDAHHDGEASLAALEQEHGPLPRTWTVRTPRGGRHYYFALADDGAAVPSPAGVRPGLDIRADGAMAVAPPSRTPAGAYVWEVSPADLAAPAPCPPWLVALARAPRAGGAPPANGQRGGVDWGQLLAGVPAGERNQRLFEAACRLRRAGVPQGLAAELLRALAARCQPPLAEREVRQVLASAWRYPAGDAPAADVCPRLVRLADVAPARLAWLWPGRVALGKLTLVEGDPGLGKSLLALDLAARVTRGLPMPDGSAGLGGPAGVVLLLAEDDLADTVRPRLDAAGADPARVVALATAGDPVDPERPPTTLDVGALRHAIRAVDARLVVVDPLAAFLPARTDAHTDADVRRALAPLARLAAEERVAVLAIRHLNKNPHAPALYRGGGSIAFLAAARSALLVARHPDAAAQRVVAVLKSNLAEPAEALAFSIVAHDAPAPRLAWHGAVAYTASELLAAGSGAGAAERASATEAVLAALPTDGEGLGPREVAEVTGLALSVVKTLLWRLRATGAVTHVAHGRWARTRALESQQPPQVNNVNSVDFVDFAVHAAAAQGDSVLRPPARAAVARLEALRADAAGPPPRPCGACGTQRWYRPRADCPDYWVCRTCHPLPPAADAIPF